MYCYVVLLAWVHFWISCSGCAKDSMTFTMSKAEVQVSYYKTNQVLCVQWMDNRIDSLIILEIFHPAFQKCYSNVHNVTVDKELEAIFPWCPCAIILYVQWRLWLQEIQEFPLCSKIAHDKDVCHKSCDDRSHVFSDDRMWPNIFCYSDALNGKLEN